MKSCSSFGNMEYGNLWDLTGKNPITLSRETAPGIFTDKYGDKAENENSEYFAPEAREKIIVVANFLPLHAREDLETGRWHFSFDEDSLLLHLKEGLPSGTEVVYVGSLKVDVDAKDQDEVAEELLEEFNCVPTFLPSKLQKKYYFNFCKQHLWPLFHYMLPLCPDYGKNLFDPVLWQAYVSANRIFADKVVEVINPGEDHVWIHDYHLMILPSILRRRCNHVNIGFFLHVPFPSSEIYRTLPVKEEILKSLLNADLIGFQTYDYACHFLSCCGRILGLDHESKRGHIGVEYFGRKVFIKILPVGVHVGWIESALDLPSSSLKAKEIQEQFKGKMILLSIDDMDIFKGISLKLQAVEQLLEKHREWKGKLVFVQIVNPARTSGTDIEEEKKETYAMTTRIKEAYGSSGYEPVVLIYGRVPLCDKIAYYASADCCVVSALRDGMNLIPYNYVVCRQGTPKMDEAMGVAANSPRTSTLVVSEFIGCSPSLSGAIRVNPWDVNAVTEALYNAIIMNEQEKQLRHEKHYRYISSHDMVYWTRCFVQDLEHACKDHHNRRCWGLGLGLNYSVLSLSRDFSKLSIPQIVSAYERAGRRVIFLDYDGTLVAEDCVVRSPSYKVISALDKLCSDSKNTVFIVSGRGQNCLGEWFAGCENLGIAAEHGYFVRWSGTSSWESSLAAADSDWKVTAERIMSTYLESTDGSYIEARESALLWNHQNADHSFGSYQSRDLLDHLEHVLANEPVAVKRGRNIVEVQLQGMNKGLVVSKILSRINADGKPADFVMCIGDDRSNEDMFESVFGEACQSSLSETPEIFACTIGQKPSKAAYYLDDTADVLNLLKGLEAAASSLNPSGAED